MRKSNLRDNFIFTALLAVLLTSGLCSCATRTLNIPPADLSAVAIVTVYGNTSIPWYVPTDRRREDQTGEISKGKLSTLVNKNLRGNNPELLSIETRIDSSAEILKNTFNSYGIDVVPPEKIYAAPSFSNVIFGWIDDTVGGVPAEGYRIISVGGAGRNKNICKETGAKSTCFVEYEFRKYKEEFSFTENHVYAHVTMKVYVADAKGRKIFQRDIEAKSDDYIIMSTIGSYNKDNLVALFPSAIQNACDKLLMYLTGTTPDVITKKVNDEALEELSEEQLSQAVQIKIPVKTEKEEAVSEEEVEEETVTEETVTEDTDADSFDEDDYEGSELDDEPEVEEE